MPASRPSVRDVARLADVSVGTVSHVLNHPERVATATRERVESAIVELGFVRSQTARGLRAGASFAVGVIVHDVSNPFYTEAARGIEDRLREDGCVPMLCSSDADPGRELDVMRLLAGMDVRGVIITPAASTVDNLGVLSARRIRVVLLDHPPVEGVSTVSGDDVAGARSAVTHLLDRGHRRIGFVNGPPAMRQSAQRRQGALGAIGAAGLEREDALVEVAPVVDGKSFTADAGAVGAARLLDSRPAPSALFCANDQMAIGAMREIRRRGLGIPDDVAVVGYDDIPVASQLITPLTSVNQQMRQMGAAAAQMLLSQEGDRHEVFAPALVVRASTVA